MSTNNRTKYNIYNHVLWFLLIKAFRLKNTPKMKYLNIIFRGISRIFNYFLVADCLHFICHI